MSSNIPTWLIEASRKGLTETLPSWYRDIYAPAPDKPTPLTQQARTTGPTEINFAKSPRGIRNHNPGNIEIGDPWQGIAKGDEVQSYQKGEERFVTFKSPEWGIRAIGVLMQTYRWKHGLTSIRGIVTRWAPPEENDTESYIKSVAKMTGFDPEISLDTKSPEVLKKLLGAIIKHENGEQPYSEETITAGINLALNIEE